MRDLMPSALPFGDSFRLYPTLVPPRVTRHGSQGPPYNRIVHERGRLVVLTNPATIENPKK